MERHQRVVSQVASKVKEYFTRKETFRISHGSTNSTRPSLKKRVVDISELRNVLKVDTASKTALVEPNVPMDRLVEATLPHGLVPPVVMEFPGITVGGGYAGTAGESSSFKYGFFDRTINSVEMVLADGEVVRASENENEDLFRGAAGAVGSLGITTLIELQLIQAQKFVKTTYYPTRSVSDAVKETRKQTENKENHYVDGILFSKDRGAVITGEMTDELPAGYKPQTFSNPWDPWFYLHVESKVKDASAPVVEYIPLAEYMFRYDRGGFWVGRSAFKYMKFPFNKYTRWFLDDFCHTRMLYRALHGSGESSRYVVQDMALPYSNAETFIDYTEETFNIWPLWLCPLKQSSQPTMHPHTKGDLKDDQMLNIGLWGFGPKDRMQFLKKNRDLEEKLGELGGMKWLYAHTYYSEGDFWKQFDRKWHDQLREKYRATTLPDVHEKVHVNVAELERLAKHDWGYWAKTIRPLAAVIGLYQAMRSGDWRIAKSSTWRWR